MINTVVLVGRLTRDPELRRTNTGTGVCSFTIAVNRSFKTPGQPDADFPRITAFGRTAENLCQYMHKGSLVGVTGRLQTGSYMDKNGQKVFTTEVLADRVEFMETKAQSEQYRAQGGYGMEQGYSQGYDNSYNQGYGGNTGGYTQNYGGYSQNNQGYGSNGYSNSGYNNSYNQNSSYNSNNSGYNNASSYSAPAPAGGNEYQPSKADYTSKPADNDVDDGLDQAFDDNEDLDISRDDLPF